MIGTLRHRLTLLTPTTADDGQGGQTVTWGTLATVWAEVDPQGGRETLQAGVIHNAMGHRLRIRYRDDVRVTQRARLGTSGPTLELVQVRDVEQRHRWLDLDAVEVDA